MYLTTITSPSHCPSPLLYLSSSQQQQNWHAELQRDQHPIPIGVSTNLPDTSMHELRAHEAGCASG